MLCRIDILPQKRPEEGLTYSHEGRDGFTLVELLIAMVLTALIGAVLFSTYILIADSGVKGRELVQSREAPRIFWGIVDKDIAGVVLSDALPLPSCTPILSSPKWQETTGNAEEPSEGICLLSFATTSSLGDGTEDWLVGPRCVEYVERQGKHGVALIRRERAFCGVDGDFPWTEAVLLTGLEDVRIRLYSSENQEWDVPEEKQWYKLGAKLPQAVRIILKHAGMEEPETLLIPIPEGGRDVLK